MLLTLFLISAIDIKITLTFKQNKKKRNNFLVTYRGLGFDSQRYHIFWVVVGLERGPLSLMRSIEELLE